MSRLASGGGERPPISKPRVVLYRDRPRRRRSRQVFSSSDTANSQQHVGELRSSHKIDSSLKDRSRTEESFAGTEDSPGKYTSPYVEDDSQSGLASEAISPENTHDCCSSRNTKTRSSGNQPELHVSTGASEVESQTGARTPTSFPHDVRGSTTKRYAERARSDAAKASVGSERCAETLCQGRPSESSYPEPYRGSNSASTESIPSGVTPKSRLRSAFAGMSFGTRNVFGPPGSRDYTQPFQASPKVNRGGEPGSQNTSYPAFNSSPGVFSLGRKPDLDHTSRDHSTYSSNMDENATSGATGSR